MLKEKLLAVLPDHVFQFKNLNRITGFYALCLSEDTDGKDQSHSMIEAGGTQQTLSLLYTSHNKTLVLAFHDNRVGMVEHLRYQCTPTEIRQQGQVEVDGKARSYLLIYRQYLGVVTGKVEWRLAYSYTPRKLIGIDREYIPMNREWFVREFTKMARNTAAAAQHRGVSTISPPLAADRAQSILNFMKDYDAVQGWRETTFPVEYAQRLRSNWAMVTGYAQVIGRIDYNEQASAELLIDFLSAFCAPSERNDLLVAFIAQMGPDNKLWPALDEIRQSYVVTT